MFFRRDLTVCCRHYPVRYRGHPFLQKGNIRVLVADTTPALRATPSTEGEFRSRSATDTASKNLAMLFHKNWRFCWQIAVAVGGCLVYKMG